MSTIDEVNKIIDEINTGVKKRTIQIQGPFETSYSLALVNRKLAQSMHDLTKDDISIYCTEGPGDYEPKESDLIDKPQAKRLWKKSKDVKNPDITIRNMWPPRVYDAPGKLNFQSFAWEETKVPQEIIDDFNDYLDGIGTTSDFVTQTLIDSGIKIPVKTIGNGVDLPENYEEIQPYKLKTTKKIKFLNIGACFPRKGMDILLEAYYETFSNDDDCCLVIKTFTNIHNDIEEQLNIHIKNHPNPPEVELINEDLSEEKLYGLYKTADCYVHSSRGEGFGLPVAEAMLAKVPVIVSPNTGLADFCNEDTALLVDYEIEPAKTHISDGESLWAKPNINTLSKLLKDFMYNKESLDIENKLENAYKLISTYYTWKNVAKRWYDFINEVQTRPKKLKIAMVTTWNSKCGVAEYARMLCSEMEQKVDFTIYPNHGAKLIREDEDYVAKRIWNINSDRTLSDLIQELKRKSYNAIHLQFHYYFDVVSFAWLIEELKDIHNVIVTFHVTKDEDISRKNVDLINIVKQLNMCSKLIVHQQEDKDKLINIGVREDIIQIIPHGQVVYQQIPKETARKQLNLDIDANRSLILGSYGFLVPHKGIRECIEALPIIKKQYPDVLYLISCALHDSDESKTYLDECKNSVSELGLEKNVIFITDFLLSEESIKLLAACEILLIPYHPTVESSSGAVRFCLGAVRPVITTKQDIFKDVAECTYQIDKCTVEEIAKAVLTINEDNDLSNSLVKKTKAKINETSWKQVSGLTYDLYEKYPMRRIKPMDIQKDDNSTSEKTERIEEKNSKIRSILKSDKLIIAFLSIFVFIVCAFFIPFRTSVHMTGGDEYSQFGIAAFLYGFDWSATFTFPYYQFGYALLIIYPCFLLFGDNSLTVYRATLALNAVLAAAIVPVTYYILKQWGIKTLKENKVYIFVILFVSLAGCIVAYATFGMPEVLLVFIGFILIALLLNMQNEKPKHSTIVLFAFLLVYGYTCHMRFMGVMAAGVFIFVILAIKKKINYKYILSFAGTFIVALIIAELLKNYFQTNLWGYADLGLLGTNDSNGVITEASKAIGGDFTTEARKIFDVLSYSGIIAFIRVSIGQLWYLGMASFLLVYVGLVYLIKDCFFSLISLIRKKSFEDVNIISIFILAGFVLTFTISVLSMHHAGYGTSSRADFFIYGRYNTLMFLPVSFYAIMKIIKAKKETSKSVLILFFSIVLIFIIQSIWVVNFYNLHHTHHSMFLSNVINFVVLESFENSSIAAIVGFLLICIGYLIKRNILISITLLFMMLFNVAAGYIYINRHVSSGDRIFLQFSDVADLKDIEKAYFIPGDTLLLQKTQMALPRTEILPFSHIDELPDFNGTPLFISGFEINSVIADNWLFIDDYETRNAVTFALKYTKDASFINLPVSLFNSGNGIVEGNTITSVYPAGYTIYGPYVTLSPGTYSIRAQLKLLPHTNVKGDMVLVEIGSAHLFYDLEHIVHTITSNDFIESARELSLHYIYTAEEEIPRFIISIFTEEAVDLTISNISMEVLP